MENKFIQSTLILTGLLAITEAFIGAVFYDNRLVAWGIVIGAGWGCANLYFLKNLLKHFLKPDAKDKVRCYIFVMIKGPLLYGIGYGLLKMAWFPVLSLIAGFSLIFMAMFLLGIYFLTFNSQILI